MIRTVLSVASARPNFVKLAAMHHALRGYPKSFRHVIVHTGQHYDPLLSDIFFEQLNIPQPDVNLGIHGGTRTEVINATAAAIVPVLQEIKPDIVLVYGDVNGAVGAARAASMLGFKVGHVEAGLRSGDLDMPEELNRIEIDGLADILFCSEQSAMDHLEMERNKGKKYLVGNTMIDTLARMLPVIESVDLPIDPPDHYAVVTLHRPSNVDNRRYLLKLIDLLGEVDHKLPVVFPMHPRFYQMITKPDPESTYLPLLQLRYPIEPLGYLQFIKLMSHADCIITDSGGIQEEATFLGKRCFTLRRNTERPSTIESGSNILINPESEYDRQIVTDFVKRPRDPQIEVPPLWDGRTGQRIAEIMQEVL